MAVLSVKNSTGYYTLKIILTEGDYSVEDNTSPVDFDLQLISGSNAHFTDFKIGTKVAIDGKTVNEVKRADAKQYTLGYNSTITLASGKTVIEHDTDGSKKIKVSFGIDMAAYAYTAGSLSGSGEMKLADIPRKATTTKASDFNDEENPTIEFTNPGGFNLRPYFNVYDENGDKVYSVLRSSSKYSSPYTFFLSDSERKAMRTATALQKTYTVYAGVQTYNGTTLLGYSSAKAILSFVNADPTFEKSYISYKDTDEATVDITGNSQVIVQNKSVVSVKTQAATGNKGAIISKYTFELNGVKKTLTSAEGGTVEMGAVVLSGTLKLKVTAIDSRGNSTSATKDVEVIPYNKPIIALHSDYGLIICKRCDANSVIDDSGTCLKLVIQGRWSSLLNSENTAKMKVQFTTTDYESAWIEIDTDAQGGGVEHKYLSWYDVNTVISDVYLNPKRAYIVTVRCTDLFGEYTDIPIKIPTEDVTFHLRKGGNGAAFGGYSVEEKILDLNDWRLKCFGAYMNDIISETGESGIWNYIKLANGCAICWGTAIVENVSITTAFGSLYYADKSLSRENYPFEFEERPQEIVMARPEKNSAWIFNAAGESGMNTTLQTAKYNVCRPTAITETQNIYYDFLVIGKIKTEE